MAPPGLRPGAPGGGLRGAWSAPASPPPSSPRASRAAPPPETLRALAKDARSWPWVEARRVVERLGGRLPDKGFVLFETGYGPSGLPHIGTFGEVARTTFVRRALEQMTGWPTRLVCFSDDMDGLRRVPDNVPRPEALEPHLGRPLSRVPDPFGEHESFAAGNNARLRAFLDSFGFDYEFLSSTRAYGEGRFDAMIVRALERHDEIMEVMLPTLGEERRATYSPVLPISPSTGRVLQVPLTVVDAARGLVRFRDEDGGEVEACVLGGGCKLQWKPDWGMRWAALGVDYEMSGKDLRPSVDLAAKVCRILGGLPPVSLIYEMFLDAEGRKISKSRGNGLSVEEWLAYAPEESLAWFLCRRPGEARRLHLDAAPRAVEGWRESLAEWPSLSEAERLDSPLWHIHGGPPPEGERISVPFDLLLALASAAGAPTAEALEGMLRRRDPSLRLGPLDRRLIGHALAFHRDRVAPGQRRRPPADGPERRAMEDLLATLRALPGDSTPESIQDALYAVGRRSGLPSLREWFALCYRSLLGQEKGPRLGTFFFFRGLGESAALVERALREGEGEGAAEGDDAPGAAGGAA